MLTDHKTKRKFRFIEDFPEYREKEAEARARAYENGEDYEGDGDSPREVETRFFGKRVFHRIAKVEWHECRVKREREYVDKDGWTKKAEEVEETFYEEKMGELGGWLEGEDNLSQEGKCWVEEGCYVMGGARVSGDAVVSGGAEIGGEAKVGGKAKVDGPVGIGGYAQVGGEAEIGGNARLAVFGNAVVLGRSKVLDDAKVYGDAKLWTVGGENWDEGTDFFAVDVESQMPYSAVVKGKSRVFGEAVVSGTVTDEAEVFGRAEVRGCVGDRAQVGGDAFLDFTGVASGDIRLLTGKVLGEVGGSGIVAWAEFSLGRGSVFYMQPEDSMAEAERYYEGWAQKTDGEKDEKADKKKTAYVGEIRSLLIGAGCSVKECRFEGDVKLSYTSAKGCEIKDSFIGPGAFWEGSFLSGCKIEGCQLYYVRAAGSELKNVASARNAPVNILDSDLERCTFMRTCSYMYGCKVKDAGIATIYIENETIEEGGYICDGTDQSRCLPEWKRWRTLFSSRASKKKSHFTYLKGFYEYVFKFRNEAQYRYAQSRLASAADPSRWGTAFDDFYSRALSRRAWLETYMKWTEAYLAKYGVTYGESDGSGDSGSDGDEEGTNEAEKVDVELARTVYLLGLYLDSIAQLPIARMAEESWLRVRASVEKTLESFNEKRFAPNYDFGEVADDPDIVALEKKYYVVFNPAIETGNSLSTAYRSSLTN